MYFYYNNLLLHNNRQPLSIMSFLYFFFFFPFLFVSSENSVFNVTQNSTLLISNEITSSLSISNLMIDNTLVPLEISISGTTSIAYPNLTLSQLGPVPVILVASVNSLYSVNSVSQTAAVDFYLTMYWPDGSLCQFTGNDSTIDPVCLYDPSNNWNPSIEFINSVAEIQTYVSYPYKVIRTPSILSQVVNETGNRVDLSMWGNVW